MEVEMNKALKLLRSNLLLSPFYLLALTLLPIESQALQSPEIGSQAPAFAARGSDGKTYELSQFKGKFVVLEWFNNECPFVEKHYGSQNMQKLQKKFTDKNVIWLTIASSAPGKQGHLTADTANTIIKERQAQATALLLDEKGDIGRLYGAKTTPHMFIINPEGKLVYQGAIDSDSSSKASAIDGAKNYVDLALTEALSNKPITQSSSKAYGCSVKYSN